MWIWDQVQWEALVARGVSQEVGEKWGTIWVEEDGPSHLLMCFWAAWGHDPCSRKASSTRKCCQTTKPSTVLRAFPGYSYSLISRYFLLSVFPDLAEDLWWICGDYPPPCSSMFACTTAAVVSVIPPLQDLGQPNTSTVPTSVHHRGWIHPALQPQQSCVLGEECQQLTDLHPGLCKPHAGNSVINLSLCCGFPESLYLKWMVIQKLIKIILCHRVIHRRYKIFVHFRWKV